MWTYKPDRSLSPAAKKAITHMYAVIVSAAVARCVIIIAFIPTIIISGKIEGLMYASFSFFMFSTVNLVFEALRAHQMLEDVKKDDKVW